jgi:hypothetical protein
MFPQSVSVGASFQRQILPLQNIDRVVAPSDNKNNNKPLDWTFDGAYLDTVHHSHNQSDDDNKSHHFHYDRFSKKRNRILLSILIKIILFVTHISSLLFASLHILH